MEILRLVEEAFVFDVVREPRKGFSQEALATQRRRDQLTTAVSVASLSPY